VHATLPLLSTTDFPGIRRGRLETLQVNLGYVCNQQCVHCHVNAGPRRKESMTRETAEQVIRYLTVSRLRRLDLTGGAPELNPNFRYLVRAARDLGVHVTDRCNLTILEEPEQEGLAAFLAAHRVEVIGSLPCHLEKNVDGQRGKGVYQDSIRALKRLNRLGYGVPGSGLVLNLVYNPLGPYLPPAQAALEADYRERLGEDHGILFNSLLTLANMPIQRFGSALVSNGQFRPYMDLLRSAHRQQNLETVMCRSLISVDWRGFVYDCDFNQMLGLPLRIAGKPRSHLSEFMGGDLTGHPIVVGEHCYGCTAGQGSSCGGALS
jgi:radical SAM/Cys-rich protein